MFADGRIFIIILCNIFSVEVWRVGKINKLNKVLYMFYILSVII